MVTVRRTITNDLGNKGHNKRPNCMHRVQERGGDQSSPTREDLLGQVHLAGSQNLLGRVGRGSPGPLNLAGSVPAERKPPPTHPTAMLLIMQLMLNISAPLWNKTSLGPPQQQDDLLEEAPCWWCGARAAKIGIITALGCLIIVGNTFVLLVIASSVSGWSRNCRYILISLTGTDAALALLVVPLNLYGSLALEPDGGPGDPEGPLGPYCHIVAFLNSSIFASSIYSLATISLERYVAVFFPLHYGRVMSRRRVSLLIAAAWLLPPAFLFPIAIPGGSVVRVYFSRASLICNPDYASNVTYSLLLTAVIFFPCSTIVTFTNLRLWLTARRQRKRLCTRGTHDAASRVLVPVVIVFYTCWAPCMVTILYNAITRKRVPEWVEFAALWLPSGNGFLNCFVYFWINRSFRLKFQQLGQRLCFWKCHSFHQQDSKGAVRTPTISLAVDCKSSKDLNERSCSMSSACMLLSQASETIL
ncbi:D(4) dopamine receptor-like [Ambystoma mexicanum]|uniref:D(4) dopamine receptor-like n=1 Tax=Ambystoma mexicanum TaxID=8296 RepID=UPI0037E881C4